MAKKRTLDDLRDMSVKELEAVFEAGTTPDFEQLVGWEFRGLNHPSFAKLIGIQKFTKGFFRKDGQPMGYNIPIKQDGPQQPWNSKPSNEDPKRYGFYTVKLQQPEDQQAKHPHALFLNYGEGENPLYTFTWVLRDYIVQVDPDNPDLYLGRAYAKVGPAQTFAAFFILERLRKSDLVDG